MFSSILLIDDNKLDNFYHRKVLEKSGFTGEIFECRDGKDALCFLQREGKYEDLDINFTAPELIFLDINMPIMNGWEFLEEYGKLSQDLHSIHIIVMLSTSTNPSDHLRASKNPFIHTFMTKPLDKDQLLQLKTNFEYEA